MVKCAVKPLVVLVSVFPFSAIFFIDKCVKENIFILFYLLHKEVLVLFQEYNVCILRFLCL